MAQRIQESRLKWPLLARNQVPAKVPATMLRMKEPKRM
jgi:hypothetical protein